LTTTSPSFTKVTFILGMGVGILFTIGVSLIVANDIDNDDN
jgi:hypothetical protein